MLSTLFAVLLIGINIIAFLLLNVNPDNYVTVDKKKLIIVVVPIIAAIVILLILNLERHKISFYMSVALFLILLIRFSAYKLMALPPDNENKIDGIVRRFFDSIVFPFFVLAISFSQCVFLFMWQ